MTSEYLSRRSFLIIRDAAEETEPVELAARLGLAVETVLEVLAGKRRPSRIVVDDDHPLRDEMLIARRCKGCGALVFTWPCLACDIASGASRATQQRVTGVGLKDKRRRTKAAARRRTPLPRAA